MTSYALLTSLALCIGLGACASAPSTISFDRSSADAFLVLSTPVNRSNNSDVFRRVDLEAGKFVGPPVIINVDTFGAIDSLTASHNQLNSNASDRSVAIAVRILPAGDYAWVESTRTAGTFGYGWVGILCLNERSPVYSLDAGEIGIVRVDNIAVGQTSGFTATWRFASGVSDAAVLGEFERARSAFRGIVGTAELRRPKAYITWPKTSGLGLIRHCAEPASFEHVNASERP